MGKACGGRQQRSDRPSEVQTGRSISSRVIGQMNSCGGSATSSGTNASVGVALPAPSACDDGVLFFDASSAACMPAAGCNGRTAKRLHVHHAVPSADGKCGVRQVNLDRENDDVKTAAHSHTKKKKTTLSLRCTLASSVYARNGRYTPPFE